VVTWQALQRLHELSKIAGEDRVARNLGLPRRIEGPRRAGQMRGAADATRAWRDDEAGLRILVFQNAFEAAEQLRVGPGIDDDAILDFDAHVEVALDAADWGNVQGLYS